MNKSLNLFSWYNSFMLIDDVTIAVKAGNGGNGAATFLHNAGQYKGGPNGGNGGDGGSVYVQGTDDLTALQQFQFKKKLKADEGIAGKHKNLYGRNAEDLIIRVPLGTRVTVEGVKNQESRIKDEIYEIDNLVDKVLIAKGGRGGRGNNSFKSATNQAPHYAEDGTPGEEKQVHFELRLIADIGLIGLPNAGKSSLLAVLTNAHPKIANYAFTTLEPNLGVMLPNVIANEVKQSTTNDEIATSSATPRNDETHAIILADIPGLIEGASQGKGLGFQFLKHIEKTKILIHCIDITSDDLLKTYETVRHEFKEYSEALFKKPEIIFLTKTDLLTKEEVQTKMKSLTKIKKDVFPISIYEEGSLAKLKKLMTESLKQT